jgi:hypothetical protein
VAARSQKIAYALAALLAAGLMLDLYASAPADFEVTPLEFDPATRRAVLLFHGSDGGEDPDVLNLAGRFAALARGSAQTTVKLYVWSPWADAELRAHQNGERVGEALGKELATLAGLQSVHLVGHSAGAYVVEPLCVALKRNTNRPVRVDMTYLDPIGIRGAFDFGWGARTFGACADYAEAYINTDDPAPGTNSPLANAWNVDITAARESAGYVRGGHRWPVRYYRDQLKAADVTAGAYSHEQRPRGAVVKP